jgi:stage III sporulation protein AG
MEKGLWQRLSGLLGDGGDKKKPRSMYVYLALLLVGVVLMFISANPDRERAPVVPPQSAEVAAPALARADYRERLERDLESHLKKIRGVGDVSVLITLEGGPVFEYAQNRENTERVTEEDDGAGGTRNITEHTERRQAVITRENNSEQALVSRERLPQVNGVLVVAGGAENPWIKEQITHAVEAALNLPSHRIRVLPMK